MAPDISCVSLGMLIIDEIRVPGKAPLSDVIGGSATFATLGLRLFTPNASKVGFLVLAGDDFPQSVRQEVYSWETTLVLNIAYNVQSSRGLLEYLDSTFGPKEFKYTTPPIRSKPANLIDTSLLHAKAFHFFGSPQEILVQVPELLRFRENEAITARPFLVWEPLPASCKPENLDAFQDACKLVDVFSPNHLEIAALFSDQMQDGEEIEEIERVGQNLVDAGIGPGGEGAVVIRAGENGAIAMSCGKATTRLPAFYRKDSPSVVDVTGAGNAFLGGYIAGWLSSRGDVKEAMCCGHVASSFALEQIGLPTFQRGDEGVVAWNGESAIKRLEEYKRRVR